MCYVDMCLLLLYVNVLYRHAPWYTHCCTHATVSCQMNAAGKPTPPKSCYIYLLTQTMGHFIPLKRHVGSVAFPICFISFSSSNMLLYIANRVMESYCKLSLSSLGFSMILIWNRNSEKNETFTQRKQNCESPFLPGAARHMDGRSFFPQPHKLDGDGEHGARLLWQQWQSEAAWVRACSVVAKPSAIGECQGSER